MYDKVCADVACGRALVLDLDSAAAIRGLRIPPLAVVLKPKVPIVHEFTFARADRRTSVNDTKYYSVPPFDPGSARCDVLLRVLLLQQKHGKNARIVLCPVNVNGAIRQVPVDPAGAPDFEYVAGGLLVLDLQLQFGWRNSPGCQGLVTSTLEQPPTRSTIQNAVMSPQGVAAVTHVVLTQPRGRSVVPLRGVLSPSPARGVIPGVIRSCGTTLTTVSLSNFNGGRTVAVAGERCSCSRRITFARARRFPRASVFRRLSGVVYRTAYVGLGGCTANPRRCVALGTEFHEDLEF